MYFGVMRGCQEQNRKGDLGRSLGNGWTGKPKADNIQHVGPGRYIWYQSRGRLVLRWGDCDIPHRKRASRARALLVVLVANMLYAFWGHA